MDEKEYRELFDLKDELHELMREIIIKTNLGDIEESGVGGKGIEDLNLEFAGGSLNSCFYYEQVRFCDSEGVEYEFDNDLEIIRKIVKELGERLEQINSLIDEDKMTKILDKNFGMKSQNGAK